MKRFATVLMVSALVFGAALAHQPAARADEECGKDKDGKPTCPLHDWMEANLDAAMEKGDLKKVAEGLEKVAGFVPDPKWNEGDNGWAKIANAGAAAAKAGDQKAVGESCKSCHKAWRKQYKAEHRKKPIKG